MTMLSPGLPNLHVLLMKLANLKDLVAPALEDLGGATVAVEAVEAVEVDLEVEAVTIATTEEKGLYVTLKEFHQKYGNNLHLKLGG